jgi:pilus assembly protein Flp/PilA
MFRMMIDYLVIRSLLFFKRDDGASAIEYVLLVAMVAVVIVTFVPTISAQVTLILQKVLDALTVAGAP